MKKLVSFGTVVALLSSCASTSHLKVGKTKEGEVVEVEASCPIMKDDLQGAQACSLAEAQKQALAKVLGVFISAKTRVEKAVAIQDNILAKHEGYISKYEIVKQKRDGEFFKTKIRAMVAFEKLGSDLKTLDILTLPSIGNPRVVINLNEQTATNAIAQALKEKGFNIVEREKEENAEILISGSVQSSSVTMEGNLLGGLKSYRASITIKATRLPGGEVLASTTLQASAVDVTDEAAQQKALANIGTKTAKELAEAIPKKLLENTTLILTLQNVENLAKLEHLENLLLGFIGIENLSLRSFQDNTALLDVTLSPKNEGVPQMASDLERKLSAKIVNLQGNAVTLKLP